MFDSHFLDMIHVDFMKNFLLADFSELLAVRLIWPPEPKTFDSYFQDMMYVDFMKNFLLGDSSKLLAIRHILASWDQKRLVLLSTPDVRWVHEQFSSRRFEPAHGF